MRQSDELRNSLAAAAQSYQAALSPSARAYLDGRGIGPGAAERFRLGTVDGSVDEHADYAGMISIPYLTKLGGVNGLKFRQNHECQPECSHSKYLTPYPSRLFNTLAFDRADRLGYVGIAEGEFDALVLDFYCGIPAVGVPGVDTWKQHQEWKELFSGYSRVLIFHDNEPDKVKPDGRVYNPGRDLAKLILHDLDNSHMITLPGKDPNETFLAVGRDEIRRIAGV